MTLPVRHQCSPSVLMTAAADFGTNHSCTHAKSPYSSGAGAQTDVTSPSEIGAIPVVVVKIGAGPRISGLRGRDPGCWNRRGLG